MILEDWWWLLLCFNSICIICDLIISWFIPSSDTLEDATFEEDDEDNDDDNERDTNANNPLPPWDDVVQQGWSVVLEYCHSVDNIALVNAGLSTTEVKKWSSTQLGESHT